jgi:hypothetical protein
MDTGSEDEGQRHHFSLEAGQQRLAAVGIVDHELRGRAGGGGNLGARDHGADQCRGAQSKTGHPETP